MVIFLIENLCNSLSLLRARIEHFAHTEIISSKNETILLSLIAVEFTNLKY